MIILHACFHAFKAISMGIYVGSMSDLVFIPRKNVELPTIIVELKHKKTSGTAIEQIKQKNYTDKIASYTGEILLVGINYDDDKGHSCVIEKFVKE